MVNSDLECNISVLVFIIVHIGNTFTLESEICECREEIRRLHKFHNEQLSHVRREMTDEFSVEKEKLFCQIRQLSTLKCAAENEVS